MGNSVTDSAHQTGAAAIHAFYSSGAWIEGRAEDQLNHLSGLDGMAALAAFPDLHPGKYGPVGCAAWADRVYPQLAGSDIGCGMALFALDLAPRKIKLDKAEQRLRVLETGDDREPSEALEEVGLAPDLLPYALGSIGGGNHFCEVQRVAEASDSSIDTTRCYLLVHSGSRGLGRAVLEQTLANGWSGLMDDSAEQAAYLERHDAAVIWAKLNRLLIAKRAAQALRCDVELVVDNAHNLIEQHKGGWLHRKGAAQGGLVPLAGSRASASYLLDTSEAPETALASCAHGAGRRYDRRSMHGRVENTRSNLEAMRRPGTGSRVICDDRDMLIEEAPQAYKSSEAVCEDLVRFGVAKSLAQFQPLITYKNVRERG